MFATYIHNWDPVIFDLFGPVKLRWYGLGYLLAFVFGYYLLRWQAKRNLWVLPADKVADFIAYAAFFGVFLGGRLGYILFYQIPKENGWSELLADPAMIIRVWDGGMASHGGILGLVVFTYVYARKNKVSWTGVGDGLCVVAPIGIGLVRFANFINGELYGRVAHGVGWAMKFPSSLHEDLKGDPERLREAYDACAAIDPTISDKSYDYLMAQARENPELQQTLGTYLQARHPSQLYEALLEGVVLFAILFVTRVRFPKLPNGILTGMFFLFYAVFRIVVEVFREPDSAMIGAMTKGQFYSTFMIAMGLAFIVGGWMRRDQLSS
ncbi:prolipoprotein diacylglyceryl transferase [Verrucomicrobiaceae bacterium N1E253]|uniref:Phosphatidylglycerol--prolipoprotein diacylglyceryl transferase n=1 Tax=Oceaniferula marina TaxID=2748318 RepID=A0A851GKI1_9BACT|nr:prolipoprotein diacylglyceryl transferase [Oceaniferula marina]NWK54674.1 prolipoprotein diacylglyceryl transferase [Oceaniferula marina]